MAKDDYHVIVYRVLVYYYACLKRKITFDDASFAAAVKKDLKSNEYLTDVLRMMQSEDLICGLAFKKIWGNEYILITELNEAEITPPGIRYLEEDSIMKKVSDFLKDSADITAKLAGMIL